MDTRTPTGPIARRIAAREAAERAAIGRPAVWAPLPLVSPFVRRALPRELPAKDLGR